MIRLLLRVLSVLMILFIGASTIVAAPPIAAPSLPFSFEQNQGQVADRYSFLFRHNGTEALFLPVGIDLQFTGAEAHLSSHLGLRLLHENDDVAIHPEIPLEGRINYLDGIDPDRWIRGVRTFSSIRYSAVYPGIDLVFYGNDSRLEHDFRVSPGADARRIAFRLEGVANIVKTGTGDLRVSVGDDILILHRPTGYQEDTHGRTPVQASFAVTGDGTIAFELGPYDHSRELVIDPALTYATYLDKLPVTVSGIATDSSGATYITGYTFFSSYGVSPNAFQKTCPACPKNTPDVYITKLDPTGTRVVYSTFLGGSDYSQPFGLTVDSSGNAIVGGYTSATDFPIKNPLPTGPLQSNGSFGFITSLSPDGSALNFSTLFNGNTLVNAVAVGPSNNVFLAGQTNSSMFPATSGALHALTPQFPNKVAFITQLTPAGSLVSSALLGDMNPQNGGAGLIGVQGLAVDTQGDAFITGAAGTRWPVTAGVYQTTIPGTYPYDAPFVTELSADASHLVFSTFLGVGLGQAIVLDPGNAIDLLSSTDESAAIYTAYLSRLSLDGSQLLQSTKIGSGSGLLASRPAALARDSSGNLWIGGSTLDPAYPLLHPVQGIGPGASPLTPSGFLSEYDSSATTLKFSSFYTAGVTSIGVDNSGIVHFAGTTVDPIYTSSAAPVPSVTAPPANVRYTYGYLALVDPNQASSAVCAPANLSAFFTQSSLGTSFSTPLKITNCGDLPLSLTSIQSSSTVFTAQDPAVACAKALAPSASCTIQVSFLPNHSGQVTGTITLLSNASIPTAAISVTGAVVPSPPNLSSNSLTFTSAPGVASPTQTITVTNVSDIPYTFSSVGVTQPFTVASTCLGQLAPAVACTVTIGFNSAIAGTFTGVLSFTDSPPTLTTATLIGTAMVQSVSVAPGSSTAATQTVTAGQAATFAFSTTSVGNFTGAATFSCTGLPQYAACSFSPSTRTVSAGASTPVALTVTTRQDTTPVLNSSEIGSRALMALAYLGVPIFWISRRHRSHLVRANLVSLTLAAIGLWSATLLLGCSGSSASPPQPTPAVTPSGTYTINVVASTASSTASTPLTLIVK